MQEIKDFTSRAELRDVSCAMLAILTHGKDSHVYGSDGELHKLEKENGKLGKSAGMHPWLLWSSLFT